MVAICVSRRIENRTRTCLRSFVADARAGISAIRMARISHVNARRDCSVIVLNNTPTLDRTVGLRLGSAVPARGKPPRPPLVETLCPLVADIDPLFTPAQSMGPEAMFQR